MPFETILHGMSQNITVVTVRSSLTIMCTAMTMRYSFLWVLTTFASTSSSSIMLTWMECASILHETAGSSHGVLWHVPLPSAFGLETMQYITLIIT